PRGNPLIVLGDVEIVRRSVAVLRDAPRGPLRSHHPGALGGAEVRVDTRHRRGVWRGERIDGHRDAGDLDAGRGRMLGAAEAPAALAVIEQIVPTQLVDGPEERRVDRMKL